MQSMVLPTRNVSTPISISGLDVVAASLVCRVDMPGGGGFHRDGGGLAVADLSDEHDIAVGALD
jgi:hypothetical protein